MVPIRAPKNGQPTSRVTLCSALIAAFGITGIYLLSLPKTNVGGRSGSGSGIDSTSTNSEEISPRTAMNQMSAIRSSSSSSSSSGVAGGSGSGTSNLPPKNKEELDEEDVDPMKIIEGSVGYDAEKPLSYYHCGPLPSDDNPTLTELVLLHGAKFTKENWKSSGILDMLCEINNEEDEGNLSISALDLPVSADGTDLGLAFDALTSEKILSGQPVTFVSPSASGKSIVSLGEMAAVSNNNGSGGKKITPLTSMVKAWIPVASGAVGGASVSTLKQYEFADIPILALYGDKDEMGKGVAQILVDSSGAKGVELEGRHAVYLDSPEEFVQEVMQYLDEEGL